MKLKVNHENCQTFSVSAIPNFKYIGFCYGRTERKFIYVYTESHGRKSRLNCANLLSGVGVGILSDPWKR